DLTAGDPVAPAQAVLDKLKADGAQVVVALLHLDYPTAKKLLEAVKGVDVAVMGHEGRAQPPEIVGSALLLAGSGERGRQAGKLTLYPESSGPWGDAGAADNALLELKSVKESLKQARARAKAAKDSNEREAYEKVAE